MSGKPWYTIKAQHDDEAEILIYDEIGMDFFGGGVSAERLVKELADIEAATLNVRINSIGGQVFEGLAIYNALERHPARVVTHVDGLAASIASVVALAGDEVRIAENAFLMVHNPHGMVLGNSHDMREMAATLDKVAGSIADVYAKRTGASDDTVRDWMDAETWFSAKDALAEKFVDVVSEKREIKAAFDLSRFGNVPKDLAARLKAHVRTPEPEPVPPADEGPDPELIQLAAASALTLSRTAL